MSNEKALVVKDNRLIEASYRLDLAEQRLILMAIVQARENNPITAETLLKVTAVDYAETCGLDRDVAYRQLRDATDSLLGRMVHLRGIDLETGKEAIVKTRWASSATYVERAGLVRIQLAPMIIPYITELQTCFTSYELKNVAQMTSSYAIRLYELLAQYKTIGERYMPLDQIKEALGATEKSYDRMDNFKRNVLKIALAQINSLTDLSVTCTDRKAGRAVIGFDFEIVKRPTAAKESPLPKKTAKPVKQNPTVSIGLSLSEKSMLKQLAAKTGKSEADILADAGATGKDLFLALDEMIRAVGMI